MSWIAGSRRPGCCDMVRWHWETDSFAPTVVQRGGDRRHADCFLQTHNRGPIELQCEIRRSLVPSRPEVHTHVRGYYAAWPFAVIASCCRTTARWGRDREHFSGTSPGRAPEQPSVRRRLRRAEPGEDGVTMWGAIARRECRA